MKNINLPRFLRVEVKEIHIKKGRRCSVMFDPIALAITEQYLDDKETPFPTYILKRVNVLYNYIWVEVDHMAFKYKVSRRAKNWIDRFDNRKPVKPQNFKFKLI